MSALPLWVLGIVLKGTLVLVLAILIASVLRHASAAVRHLVWGTSLVILLVLPIASILVPWRLPVASLAVFAPPAPASMAQPTAPVDAVRPKPAIGATTLPSVVGPPPVSPATNASNDVVRTVSPRTVLFVVLAVWGLGALFLVGRLIIGGVLLRRVVRRATPLEDSEWRRPLLEASDRLSLERLPRLVMSDRLPMPFACGLVRPAIVLPEGAGEWGDRRRQAVLFHELAHLIRYDLIGNAVGQLACAVYWFHPLVWLAARKLRIESERACDDLVLGVGTRASEYADHLLQIVCRAARSRTPAIALPMAQRHEFEGRMLAILERGARREPASGRHAMALGALSLALVLPLAALAPGRKASAARPVELQAERIAVDTPQTKAARGVMRTEQHTSMTVHTETHTLSKSPAATVSGLAPDSAALVTALLRALDDSVAAVREDAAYALGRLEARTALPGLQTRLLRDPSGKVREMIAWALGQIQSRTASDPLGTAAQHDSSEDTRAMAVWAIGQIQDPAAVPALVQVLRDPAAEVRGRAAWALGQIQPAKAPAGLVEALGDRSADVRMKAAWALGQIADSSTASRLAVAMNDSDTDVRKATMWALGQMEGNAAQAVLIRALDSKDADVRARAARSLAGGRSDPWPWPWPLPILR